MRIHVMLIKTILFIFMILTICIQFSGISFAREVKFGVVGRYAATEIVKTHSPMLKYLSVKTGYDFAIKLAPTFDGVIDDLGKGITDIALLGPITYITAHEKYGAAPILKALDDKGKASYQSMIIVRSNNPFKSIQDLKGKKFAFGDKKSSSSYLMPRYMLAKNGIELNDLAEHKFLGKHDNVVLGVLNGIFDAGGVKDVVAEKNKDKGIKILAISDPIPAIPIVVRKDADSELIKRVKSALASLKPLTSKEDKEITKDWDKEIMNGFSEAKDSDYNIIRELIKKLGPIEE